MLFSKIEKRSMPRRKKISKNDAETNLTPRKETGVSFLSPSPCEGEGVGGGGIGLVLKNKIIKNPIANPKKPNIHFSGTLKNERMPTPAKNATKKYGVSFAIKLSLTIATCLAHYQAPYLPTCPPLYFAPSEQDRKS